MRPNWFDFQLVFFFFFAEAIQKCWRMDRLWCRWEQPGLDPAPVLLGLVTRAGNSRSCAGHGPVPTAGQHQSPACPDSFISQRQSLPSLSRWVINTSPNMQIFLGFSGRIKLPAARCELGGESLQELCCSLELSLIIGCKRGGNCEKAAPGAKRVCIIVHPVKSKV